MKLGSLFWLFALYAMGICGTCGTALAQPPQAAVPGPDDAAGPPGVSAEHVQAQLAQLQALAATDQLSAAEREQAEQYYKLALAHLQTSERHGQAAARYRHSISAAPGETARLQTALGQIAEQPAPAADTDKDTDYLQDLLAVEQAQLAALRKRAAELDKRLPEQQARPAQARAELAETRLQLAELEPQLQAPPAAGESGLLAEARLSALSAKRQALAQRSESLELELASHEVRLALMQAQRALTVRQSAVTEARIAQLQQRLNARRRSASEQALAQAEQATQQAADKPAVVRATALANSTLSQQLAELVGQIEALDKRQPQLDQRLQELEERHQSIRQQLSIAGLSEALGPVLRHERRNLPEVRHYQRDSRAREQRIAEARLKQFQFDEQRRNTDVSKSAIERLIAESEADFEAEFSPAQRASIADELGRLLQDRLALLDQLSGGYSGYVSRLVAAQERQEQLVDTAQRYAALLDENLFWIAGVPPVDWAWLATAQRGLQALLHTAPWGEVWQGFLAGALALPGWTLLGLALWIGLLWQGRRLRRTLGEAQGHIGNVAKDRFSFTLRALLVTLLLTLPLPGLAGLLGALLTVNGGVSEFAAAVGYGLFGVAFFMVVVIGLRQLCRRRGLGLLHFRWPELSCRLLRRHLNWYLPVGVPCAFLVALGERYNQEWYRDPLGRLAFVIGALALALLLGRVLHPRSGALCGYFERRRVLWRSRYLWYPLIVVLPMALALLALLGYYHTALQLLSRLFLSACLLVGAALVGALVLRWLRIEHRRLAWSRARAKREALLAARAKEPGAASGEGVPENLEIETIDLEAVSEQSRGLLRLSASLGVALGLWLIWYDQLPALEALNKVELWRQAVPGIGGESVAITLGNVVLALALLALLGFVARNLPGLLEVAVLQRFEMDAGDRYATTTIVRYLIVIVGLVTVLNIVGLSWDRAQWLVAALGVGLGFGLQEIFANFVSGLILLLERPIRIGDTVTLGDLTGTVTRLRIRATTITDFDRKEILVPNKTFITESLINWTLTDPITRVVIPVGVAYGADTVQVKRVLAEIVEAHPLVLREPAPAVLFLAFGESALNFEVRVFVRELADRLPLIHELHERILQALRENGIDIPYPQRDLHIRSGLPNAGSAV